MRTMKDITGRRHREIRLVASLAAMAVIATAMIGAGYSISPALAKPPHAGTSDLLKTLPNGHRPKRLTFAVSGVDVRKLRDYHIKEVPDGNSDVGENGSIAYYDPARRYYLFLEFDNPKSTQYAMKTLMVVPKSRWKDVVMDEHSEYVAPSKVFRKSLFLVADTDVKIGDSAKDVVKKLGPASEIDPDYLQYRYFGGKLNGWSYLANYDFHNNRLTEIDILMQIGPEVAG